VIGRYVIIGGGAIGGSIKGNSIAKNPILPGSQIMRKELINEFHEHTSILEFKILNTEPSIIFSGTHIFPGHQTTKRIQKAVGAQSKILL
jgi:hypothetical protein